MWYAIDFGTSNTLLSFVEEGRDPRVIELEKSGPVMRSLIFTPEKGSYYFGEDAIDCYQELGGEGRFFRSLKKFLPDPNFKGTEVFGRRMKIEELIATFLREVKKRADKETGHDVTNVVMGRPALYSLDLDSDQLAEDRMRQALKIAGFKNIEFCPEPIAAGLNNNSDESEKVILVCDFGGGTSDFTLLKMDSRKFSRENVLGLSGVFVAGDAIDGRIMRDFISSHFGKDVKYQLPMGDNLLNFPRKFLKKLCNPAHIAFFKERDTWEFLKELEQWALEGEDQRYFKQLFCLIEEDLGYPVYANIEKTKIDLGENLQSLYRFQKSDIDIEMLIKRVEFEEAVRPEFNDIWQALHKVFEQSGLKYDDVDKVCITGGTGQMPLLRKELEAIFGREKIEMSDIFRSVVHGLGKYAQENSIKNISK